MRPLCAVVTGRLQGCHNPLPGAGRLVATRHSASLGGKAGLAEYRFLRLP